MIIPLDTTMFAIEALFTDAPLLFGHSGTPLLDIGLMCLKVKRPLE